MVLLTEVAEKFKSTKRVIPAYKFLKRRIKFYLLLFWGQMSLIGNF